jgi:predicted dehydrogenase
MEEAAELVELSRKVGRILSVGHQERFVFARTGLLDLKEMPVEITCWRQGPWTGRGDDVSVILDLMIHDLDLVHTLLPGKVVDVRAEGLIEYGPHADEVFALLRFDNGAIAKLETSRVASERKRGLRAVMLMAWWRSISCPAPSRTPRRVRWVRWNWVIRWANPWPGSSPPPRRGWTRW